MACLVRPCPYALLLLSFLPFLLSFLFARYEQDAEECVSELLSVMKRKLTDAAGKNAIADLFEFDTQET